MVPLIKVFEMYQNKMSKCEKNKNAKRSYWLHLDLTVAFIPRLQLYKLLLWEYVNTQ